VPENGVSCEKTTSRITRPSPRRRVQIPCPIRHGSRQVFGLAGYLVAPASQSGLSPWLDDYRTSASVGAFVPAYRCGAVPDLRRIPFSGEACDSPPKAELTIS
jgi:hypothetical protein